jgi:predicted nucleic acid-binding protein
MIVISDTGPLNYLTLIGHLDVLPALYDSVVIPPAVVVELSRPSTPPKTGGPPIAIAMDGVTMIESAIMSRPESYHLGRG